MAVRPTIFGIHPTTREVQKIEREQAGKTFLALNRETARALRRGTHKVKSLKRDGNSAVVVLEEISNAQH